MEKEYTCPACLLKCSLGKWIPSGCQILAQSKKVRELETEGAVGTRPGALKVF